jgi:PTH1 family peptidyl-tRNA hydrolase
VKNNVFSFWFGKSWQGVPLRVSTKHYGCKSLFGKLVRKTEEEIILLKPQTYMNLSGEAVLENIEKYRVSLDKILLIHDDMDLPFGTIRLKNGGSSGGHKGIKSTVERLKADTFCRLKIGIGKPSTSDDVVDYVLETFNCSEKKDLPSVIQEAILTTLDFVDSGFNFAANKHNES